MTNEEEMAKAVSDASEDSLFRDAEKCFRSMGDNSGVAHTSSNPYKKQRDMNKIKKTIRSLNPVIRTAIVLVVAFIVAMLSGFFFGHYLGNSSPIAFFVFVVFATFVIVGIYIHLIEDDDE